SYVSVIRKRGPRRHNRAGSSLSHSTLGTSFETAGARAGAAGERACIAPAGSLLDFGRTLATLYVLLKKSETGIGRFTRELRVVFRLACQQGSTSGYLRM